MTEAQLSLSADGAFDAQPSAQREKPYPSTNYLEVTHYSVPYFMLCMR